MAYRCVAGLNVSNASLYAAKNLKQRRVKRNRCDIRAVLLRHAVFDCRVGGVFWYECDCFTRLERTAFGICGRRRPNTNICDLMRAFYV